MRESWKSENGHEVHTDVGSRDEPIRKAPPVEREAGLGHNCALLESILHSLADGVVVADEDGRFLLFNKAAERILGMRAEEIPPTEWSSTYGCFLPDRVTPYPSEDLPLARALRGEHVRGSEIFVRNQQIPSGAWINVNSSPLHDEEGRRRGGLAVFRDITEGKQAHDVAHRLSEAVERTTDSVFITDASGRIEYVNPAFEKTTGFSRDEAIGKQPNILKSGEHGRDYYDKLWETILAGNVHRATVTNRRKNGEIFYAEQTITPILDGAGNLTHFVSVVKDITELKKAEEREVEMRIARRVQQRLYPSQSPQIAGYDIAGGAYPAEATGGDYFDFLPMPEGCLGMALGDVSGHGFGSALLMAETRAYLRSLAQSTSDVGEILQKLNFFLGAETGADGLFVTLMLARLDPSRGVFTYASAGHNPCYLLDSSGAVSKVLEATGLPLGIYPDRPIETSSEIEIGRGEILLMLTDGIAEAENTKGEHFGDQRILEMVARQRNCKARAIVESLYQGAREFSAFTPQLDDITAVICKMD
jgi:sigma-B regulation protein RsbU (phosphoserine phosphatase)